MGTRGVYIHDILNKVMPGSLIRLTDNWTKTEDFVRFSSDNEFFLLFHRIQRVKLLIIICLYENGLQLVSSQNCPRHYSQG